VPGPSPRAFARARAQASRFPRGFWVLLFGDVFQSLGFGLIMPYLTLYLTEEIGTSAALAGVLLALFSIGAFAGTPLGGVAVGEGSDGTPQFTWSTVAPVLSTMRA